MADQVRTRPRDRRASILAAARARFHRHGYSGTSLEDIAGDLGITAPALYRHFRGKDALYTAALESNLRHLEECVAEGSSAEEVVRGLARVAVEHPTIGLLWNPDRRRRLTDPDGSIQQRLGAAADTLGALFGRGVPSEIAHLRARGVLAALSSTGFYETTLGPESQAEQLERALTAVAVFRPARPLVDIEVSSEEVVSRPWTTRRSALLDVGAQLIVRRGGYQAVTIEEIAATAGVSPNTVYSYFGGKADLFVAVIRRAVSWLASSLEQASAQAGYPAPVLQLSDELNLKLMRKIRNAAREAQATGSGWDAHPSEAVIDAMLDEHDRPGKLEGKGFYEYADGKRTGLWKGLREAFPPVEDPSQLSLRDLEERMLFIEAIESVKCLDEGVIETVSDANIGSIMGIGFPGWTGGVLQYINGYEGGLAGFVARAQELAEQYGERFTPPASLVERAERNEPYLDDAKVAATA